MMTPTYRTLCVVTAYMYICTLPGTDAGPSAALVSQMMEEALSQNDQLAVNKDRSG